MKSCCKEATTDPIQDNENKPGKNKMVLWLKRIGVAGFVFFLVKGILWLTVGAAVLKYAGCEH